MGKRFRELTQTATDADFVEGNYFGVDTPSLTKKVPANLLAKQSELETTNSNVTNLQSAVTDLQTKISEFYRDEFLIDACLFNLIDLNDDDVALEKYIKEDGSLSDSSNYNTTGYMPVVGGVEYKVSYDWTNARCICWFDAQKVAIGFAENVGTVTAPANAAFARLTVHVNKWETQMFAPKESLPSTYLEYGKFEFKDNFKLYDKFSEMKGLLDIHQCEFIEYNLIDLNDDDVALEKYIKEDGSLSDSSNYNTTGYMPVVGGVEYKVSYDWTNARFICWFDAQKVAIGFAENVVTVTAPANAAFARLTVHVNKWEMQMFAPKESLPSTYLEYGKFEFKDNFKLYDKFSEMKGLLDIHQCEFIEYNLIDKEANDVELGKFVIDDGRTLDNASYNTTGYMPVVGGVEYKVSYDWTNARCICWFDAQKVAIGYAEYVVTVTAPANAAFARLTVPVNKWEMQMFAPKESLPSTYLEYGKRYIKKSVLPSGNISSPGFRINDGALSVDSSLSISGFNVTKNTLINAHVKGSIDMISVGVGYLGYYGYWVEITPTQAVVKSGSSGTVQQTLEHGLTFDNELSVTIDRSMSLDGVETTRLRMVTQKGGVYEHELTWDVAPGTVFVRNQNSSGTLDCSLSFMLKDSSKCVWLFGDSYMGYRNPSRWPYYIVSQLHYTNFLLNALGGENSSGALSDFKTILGGVGNRPLFAVWLQGMNGGNDGEGVPNSTWLANTEEFIRICQQEGIIPVLSTIPTVPNSSHVHMNEWVRSSGCRYIDLASSVEKEGTATWKFYGETEAYLYSDLVHPTSYGAKAMCEQVLKDFPEISIGIKEV